LASVTAPRSSRAARVGRRSIFCRSRHLSAAWLPTSYCCRAAGNGRDGGGHRPLCRPAVRHGARSERRLDGVHLRGDEARPCSRSSASRFPERRRSCRGAAGGARGSSARWCIPSRSVDARQLRGPLPRCMRGRQSSPTRSWICSAAPVRWRHDPACARCPDFSHAPSTS
jgi:hypothetical protein